MKNRILLCLLLLTSCRPTDRAIISKAESVVTEHPDSAVQMLNTIARPERLGEPWLSRYYLATGQAHANRHEALTEDSAVCHALAYYESAEPQDSARVIQATQLAAGYHWWSGDKEKAYELLEGLLEALCRAGNETKTTEVLEGLYQMASYDEQHEKAERYLDGLMERNDDRGTALLYWQDKGILGYYKNDVEAVMETYDSIVQYDRHEAYRDVIRRVMWRNYADMFSTMGYQQRAIGLQNEVLDYAVSRNDTAHIALAFASLARYYLLSGEVKQAARCLRQADGYRIQDSNRNLSNAGYYNIIHWLVDYALTGHVDFKQWAVFVNDLEAREEYQQKVGRAKERSKRQLEERNWLLVLQQQKAWMIGMVVVFVLLVSLAVLVYYNVRRKKLFEEKAEELETLRQLAAESKSVDRQDDRFFKKIMLQQLGVIQMTAANPTVANQDMLKRMAEVANKDVNVDTLLNWDDLYGIIDYLYNDFHKRLAKRYGDVLNEKEIQLCTLLRANFSTKEISVVTQQGVRTVYQRKTVIRQKLRMDEGEDIVVHIDCSGDLTA